MEHSGKIAKENQPKPKSKYILLQCYSPECTVQETRESKKFEVISTTPKITTVGMQANSSKF
jgi:hypothetical protein